MFYPFKTCSSHEETNRSICFKSSLYSVFVAFSKLCSFFLYVVFVYICCCDRNFYVFIFSVFVYFLFFLMLVFLFHILLGKLGSNFAYSFCIKFSQNEKKNIVNFRV